MNEQLAAIKARRDAANPETWGAARARMALDDITTLLAMVDALTGEAESHRKDAEWLNAKWVQENNAVAARTAERDALALELSHLRPEWRTVCAERDALRAQADRYGVDQWRRGNAGQEPQEFSEWQRKVQP